MSDFREGYAKGREEVLRELAQLRGLVRELAGALDHWADSKDDLVLADLIARARKAGNGR